MTEHDEPRPDEPAPVTNEYQRLWAEAQSDVDDFDDLDDGIDRLGGGDADMADAYINGFEPTKMDDGSIVGGDAETLAKHEEWLAGLPAERRAELEQTRTEILADRAEQDAGVSAVEARLKIQAPELLQGTLPPEMAELMPGPFALGINQSIEGGAADAADYLQREHGLPLLNYTLGQRFEVIDQATDEGTIRAMVTLGHYGNSEIGRFVVAIPLVDASDEEAAAPSGSVLQTDNRLPADFYNEVAGPHGASQAVDGKYVAGFIDGEGNWHVNRAFGSGLDLDTGDDETDWV